MNPLRGVCLLCQEHGNRLPAFLGTCFAFRHRNYYVTAAHCIANLGPENFAVLTPWEGLYSLVGDFRIHSSADLAIVKLAGDGRETVEPFTDFRNVRGVGAEYFAYGYPEDSMGPNAGTPTARLFKGHSQRSLFHQSHMDYAYGALELSFPCPGGLSGGPLFEAQAPAFPVGLITENVETSTILDSEEVSLKDGQRFVEYYRRIISYGVALLLHEHLEWINDFIPAISASNPSRSEQSAS